MGIVAVAGGTGDLGKTIVEQLVSGGKHEVFVLTRKPNAAVVPGAKIATVDYSNVDETCATLDANNIDTVISTLGHGSAEAQLSLIAAADKATSTTRFVPSQFAWYLPPGSTDPSTADARHAADVLSNSSLEYTRFAIGIFMDYYGFPNIPSSITNYVWNVSVPAKRAAIPGTGDDVFTVTYSKDVARFVERILDDHDWPEWSIIGGSDITSNQIVAMAEKLTGHKFDVAYDSKEKLEKNEATVISPDAGYGGMDPQTMGRLNEKYPEIKPMTIEELMTKAWKEE